MCRATENIRETILCSPPPTLISGAIGGSWAWVMEILALQTEVVLRLLS